MLSRYFTKLMVLMISMQACTAF